MPVKTVSPEPNAAILALWIYKMDRGLLVHGNPSYVSSLGESRAAVAGCCGCAVVEPSKGPPAVVEPSKGPPADKNPEKPATVAAVATVDPLSFGRYLLDV